MKPVLIRRYFARWASSAAARLGLYQALEEICDAVA
jgi:hypothetical protein